ncbi:glycoside hydrolase [Cladorrhinum sp. PSN259]|nr:glycoside hydrolase [Cladorrhinum sp. PSN259]
MGLKNDWENIVSGQRTRSLRGTSHKRINTYEANVRIVGSLLANFEMTGKNLIWIVLYQRALDLTSWYKGAFDTPNGIPKILWDKEWYDSAPDGMQTPNGLMTLNELARFALEFTKLTQLTRNPWYWKKVLRNKFDTFNWDGKYYGLGKDGDEFYTHLSKLYALVGGANEGPREWGKCLMIYFERLYMFQIPNPDNIPMLLVGKVEPVYRKTPYKDLPGYIKYKDKRGELKNTNILKQHQCSAGATFTLL